MFSSIVFFDMSKLTVFASDLYTKVRQGVIYEIYRKTSSIVKGWFPLGIPIPRDMIDALDLRPQPCMDESIVEQLSMIAVRARATGVIEASNTEFIGAAVLYSTYRMIVGVWSQEADFDIESHAIWIKAQVTPSAFLDAKRQFSQLHPPASNFDSQTRFLIEVLLMKLAQANPALAPFRELFGLDADKSDSVAGVGVGASSGMVIENTLISHKLYRTLMKPIVEAPNDVKAQLRSVVTDWSVHLPKSVLETVLRTVDILNEAQMPRGNPGPVPRQAPPNYSVEVSHAEREPDEQFTPDRNWMSNVVLVAKQTHVWLSQLSQQYERTIERLDEIPDEELERLSRLGFTGLWLIGVWSRSKASKAIKIRMGNPDALASAYALDDYQIAMDLGGEEAYEDLVLRARTHGIRLAADMVPNHVGIDGKWVRDYPERFVQTSASPYENYRFDGPDLCEDPTMSVFLEDGYYARSDAAVVFKRIHHETGDVRYIYHGNDGTQMPWNDTAQLDYLNPEVREHVIQLILSVARRFPIIRFDAAMTLAKTHI